MIVQYTCVLCIGTAIWTSTSTYQGLDKHVTKYFYDAIIGELPTEILYFCFLEKKFPDSSFSLEVLLINLLCFPDKKKGMAMSLFYNGLWLCT